jgi:hypothetical protein
MKGYSAATEQRPQRAMRSALLDRVLPAAIVLSAVSLVALAFWPGRMSADTLDEILQAKTAAYTDQHAPILEALWHPFFKHGIGPGWVLAAQLLVFAGGSYLILRLHFRPVAAAAGVAFIMLTPTVFGMLGWVGRDMWFAAFLVATFGCVGRASVAAGRARRAWLAAALVLAWLTLTTHQDAAAAVFVPVSLVSGAWLARRRPALALSRRRLAVGAVASGLALTLAMMGSQALVNRALDVRNTRELAAVFAYDLAALSRQDHRNLFPASVLADRSMRVIATATSTDSIEPLLLGANAPIPYPPIAERAASALQTAWIHQVLADPLGYLHQRLKLMLDQLAVAHSSIWVYEPSIDPNTFGYHTTIPWANHIANSYMQAFTDGANNGDVLFSVWLYLLACAGAAVLLRSQSPQKLLIGAMAASAITYQLGVFFAPLEAGYRFDFPAVVIAEIAMLSALSLLWQRVAPRRRE